MVRIGGMSNWIHRTDRRELVVGLGAAAIAAALPTAPALARQPPVLRARADTVALRQGAPDTPVWAVGASNLRLDRTEKQEIAFENGLPIPAVLNWRGISGARAGPSDRAAMAPRPRVAAVSRRRPTA